MKWSEVPDGVSFAMSKETAMSMRTSRVRPFIAGAICGALLIISVQGDDDGGGAKKPDNQPSPSITTPAKPSND